VNRRVAVFGLVLGISTATARPAFAQPAPRPQQEQPEEIEQEPPEEDGSVKPQAEYTFNPLQAEKEMKIGAFYFKRGSFPAAAKRFEEATKWNPGFAEAWRRLGEAHEKLNEGAAAATAYKKFIELAPTDKQAAAIKKKLATVAKLLPGGN
jgi:tetratricopeptide (TPR) repeat protein